jgi:tetraacyldisaccharide 4'-kinase
LVSWLQAIWYRASPPPWPLRLCARLFGVIVRVRRWAYVRGCLRAPRLTLPVIIVGNLSVGGSGKTPLVIWLVRQLRLAGYSPGVILRGYGGSAARHGRPLLVQAASDAALVGDEALLLRARTAAPVAVCRDRVRAARLLIDQGVTVIVSDDGLQHLALARDFEIAVIDGERGLGNGYLLPAGPLRERPERLGQMDAIVVNGEGRVRAAPEGFRASFTMHLIGASLLPLAGDGAPVALSSLAGHRVHAVAGIGHPQRFFAHLRAAGLLVIEHPFPDHHSYRAGELAFGDELPVLMTEKDAVKCRTLTGPNHWYLPVTASFDEAEAALLLRRLRRSLEPQSRS